jgi:hypothetical protein
VPDNFTPGTTEAPVATDDIGGVHYQLFKTGYGADGAYTGVTPGTGMPIASGYKELTGTASANNTDLIASTDVSAYRWFSVQATGTFSATLKVQGSNDGTAWTDLVLTDPASTMTSGTPLSISINATGTLRHGPIPCRYLRIRTSAYSSGTVGATLELFAVPPPLPATAVTMQNLYVSVASITNSGDALSGATSAMTCFGEVFNGTTWDRARSVTAANGTTGTGLTGAGLIGYDATGAVYRRALVDGSGNQLVTPTPGTTGGWSVSSQTALSSTKTEIKASSGTVGGYMIYNPNTAVAHVQIWNVASGSITVGTTAPTYVLSIPAGSAANLELTCGVAHSTAINVAATTTPTGSTAPASPLVCAFFYK